MKEKGINKTTFSIIICAFVFVALCGVYAAITKGTAKEKSNIEKVASEYIQKNYPELNGRIQYSTGNDDGPFFRTKDKWDSEYTDNMEDGDGVWVVRYTIDNDGYQQFILLFNRKGDKLLMDGYKDNYMLGGTIMRQKSYEFNDLVYEAFKYESNQARINKQDTYYYRNIPQSYFGFASNNPEQLPNFEFYNVYNGPVLDLDKKYSVEEMAKEYGVVQFHYRNADKDVQTIYEHRLFARDFLKRNNIPFDNVNITMDTFYGVYGLTAEELMSDDLESVIKENCGTMGEHAKRIAEENKQ